MSLGIADSPHKEKYLMQALKELKDDFEAQIEYIEEAISGYDTESNLDYLIRDNSELVHNHTTETRLRNIVVLKEFYDDMFGDSDQ
jgi:hypothetical protein